MTLAPHRFTGEHAVAVEEHRRQPHRTLGRHRVVPRQVGVDQRPPPLGAPRTQNGERPEVGLALSGTGGSRLASGQRTERGEGVVGDLARPDEIPQGVEALVVVATRQFPEEAGAPLGEDLPQPEVLFGVGALGSPRPQDAGVPPQEQHHLAVVAAERPGPDPRHLARGRQLVEQGG